MSLFDHVQFAADTNVGRRRKNNEDAYLVLADAGVFVVADGMGGGAEGEYASRAVVEAIADLIKGGMSQTVKPLGLPRKADLVRRACNRASRVIRRRMAELDAEQMGSTFVGLVLDAASPDQASILHAGDSRGYRSRGGTLAQLTRDHSVSNELGVAKSEALPAIYQGVLTRAVGLRSSVEVQETSIPVQPGDLFVLCSDGLSNMVPHPKLEAIIAAEGGKSPKDIVEALVAAALQGGGKDNITVVVLKFGELPTPVLVDAGGAHDEEETASPTEREDESDTNTPSSDRTLLPTRLLDDRDEIDPAPLARASTAPEKEPGAPTTPFPPKASAPQAEQPAIRANKPSRELPAPPATRQGSASRPWQIVLPLLFAGALGLFFLLNPDANEEGDKPTTPHAAPAIADVPPPELPPLRTGFTDTSPAYSSATPPDAPAMNDMAPAPVPAVVEDSSPGVASVAHSAGDGGVPPSAPPAPVTNPVPVATVIPDVPVVEEQRCHLTVSFSNAPPAGVTLLIEEAGGAVTTHVYQSEGSRLEIAPGKCRVVFQIAGYHDITNTVNAVLGSESELTGPPYASFQKTPWLQALERVENDAREEKWLDLAENLKRAAPVLAAIPQVHATFADRAVRIKNTLHQVFSARIQGARDAWKAGRLVEAEDLFRRGEPLFAAVSEVLPLAGEVKLLADDVRQAQLDNLAQAERNFDWGAFSNQLTRVIGPKVEINDDQKGWLKVWAALNDPLGGVQAMAMDTALRAWESLLCLVPVALTARPTDATQIEDWALGAGNTMRGRLAAVRKRWNEGRTLIGITRTLLSGDKIESYANFMKVAEVVCRGRIRPEVDPTHSSSHEMFLVELEKGFSGPNPGEPSFLLNRPEIPPETVQAVKTMNEFWSMHHRLLANPCWADLSPTISAKEFTETPLRFKDQARIETLAKAYQNDERAPKPLDDSFCAIDWHAKGHTGRFLDFLNAVSAPPGNEAESGNGN